MNILITGANRGLGLAITAEACARGYQVLAGVRSPGSSVEGLQTLSNKFPEQITVLPLDVTDENSVRYAYDQVSIQMSSLDAVINNAAILLGREQKLEQLDFDQVEQSFQTNLFGPMIVLKYFLAMLQKGERQAVVNISSEAGSFAGAYGGDYSYALSKAALNMFSAQLRRELAPHGILVHALHPGWIRTDMGGGEAPGEAAASAEGILDIIERRTEAENQALFIDHNGKPMSI
ncbi:SDR family oxidoreductase [Paenibacillus massiliensis]|uniref:SDR family oxidoreductase n=1 Tax=Paenibacillus massiliensis TaxID=225917 RepID=UPI00037B7BBF|nr:SDR family oxidoreductase [Paenibacillus massiliensis]